MCLVSSNLQGRIPILATRAASSCEHHKYVNWDAAFRSYMKMSRPSCKQLFRGLSHLSTSLSYACGVTRTVRKPVTCAVSVYTLWHEFCEKTHQCHFYLFILNKSCILLWVSFYRGTLNFFIWRRIYEGSV